MQLVNCLVNFSAFSDPCFLLNYDALTKSLCLWPQPLSYNMNFAELFGNSQKISNLFKIFKIKFTRIRLPKYSTCFDRLQLFVDELFLVFGE